MSLSLSIVVYFIGRTRKAYIYMYMYVNQSWSHASCFDWITINTSADPADMITCRWSENLWSECLWTKSTLIISLKPMPLNQFPFKECVLKLPTVNCNYCFTCICIIVLLFFACIHTCLYTRTRTLCLCTTTCVNTTVQPPPPPPPPPPAGQWVTSASASVNSHCCVRFKGIRWEENRFSGTRSNSKDNRS